MAASLSDLQRAALDFMIEFKKENPSFITDFNKGQNAQDLACLVNDAVCGCHPKENVCITIGIANELTGMDQFMAITATGGIATDIHAVNITAATEEAIGGSTGSGGETGKKLTSPERGKTISLEDLIRVRQNLR